MISQTFFTKHSIMYYFVHEERAHDEAENQEAALLPPGIFRDFDVN